MENSDQTPKQERQVSLDSGLSLSAEDALKFMIERAHFESQMYWTRTNVFLLINAVASGLAVQMITGPGDWTVASLVVLLCVATIGALFGIAWWRMQSISQYYNHVWMADARRVALRSRDAALADRYLYSLGLRARLPQRRAKEAQLILSLEQGAASVKGIEADSFDDTVRPMGRSATEYMELVIIGVIVVWILIGTSAVTGIALLSRYQENSGQSGQSNRGIPSVGSPHNTGAAPDSNRTSSGRHR